MPRQAITDEEIEKCFDVMSELRVHLLRDEFLATVRQMEKEGYKLALIEEQGRVVATAGYRIYTNLFMGKHLYVDDLVTSETVRSKGYGELMVKWLREEAIKAGCHVFHLDSGTHRGEAHKFYFRQGFTIASYHFSTQLRD
ncbi:MAG: GNAT family N-acetyltransferase [Gammaproteobacteria bacterium]|nr:GNAT family N-acetyltransferase [Gammaproteobacteria bacterium]